MCKSNGGLSMKGNSFYEVREKLGDLKINLCGFDFSEGRAPQVPNSNDQGLTERVPPFFKTLRFLIRKAVRYLYLARRRLLER